MGMLIYSVGALSLLLLCTAPASALSVPAFELEKSDEAQRELGKIQNAGNRNKTSYKRVHILVEKGGSRKWPPCKGSHVKLSLELYRTTVSSVEGSSSSGGVVFEYQKDIFRDCAEGETSSSSSAYSAPDCCKDTTSVSGSSSLGQVGSFKSLLSKDNQIHAEASVKLPLTATGAGGNAKLTAVISFTLDCVKSTVSQSTLSTENCYGDDCITIESDSAAYSCTTRGGDATIAGTIDVQGTNVKFDLASLPAGYFRSANAQLSTDSTTAVA
eukprot:TRINITY_DN20992_c0_g1_i1.p1 TRINITY_DN20992_c0_g1~~TRINITY_DN20992_c0_g1_i1.p1  ORF type:complete len:291 (-),score=34.92 TRINITY_DN20992_c0_g1_i1:642-1454(-)